MAALTCGLSLVAAPTLRAQCVEGPANNWQCSGADLDGLDATTNGSPDVVDVIAGAQVADGGALATILMTDGTFTSLGFVTNMVVSGTGVFASGSLDASIGVGAQISAGASAGTGIASHDGTLTNTGAVEANGPSGVAMFTDLGDVENRFFVGASGDHGIAILTGSGDNTVTQRNVAQAFGPDGIAIVTGSGTDTVVLGGNTVTEGGMSTPGSLCTVGVTLAVCAGDGNDTVEVQNGAFVDGVIDGAGGTDTLRFKSLTPAQLAGQSPASGTVTINGISYTWLNFESLVGSAPIVSIADVSQSEGTGGSTVFTFVLTRGGDLPAASVLVSTADGGAVSPGDFAARSNVQVSFPADQASATFDVTVVADPDVEPEEGFQVVLSSPTGMQIADGTADATIVNDDFPSVIEVPILGEAGRLLLGALLGLAALILLRRFGADA